MKRLVIAPHVDDDVLGCASVLDADTVTFYCGVDYQHVVTFDKRRDEAKAVYECTGGRFQWTPPERRRVNAYELWTLIVDIEEVIATEQPDEVFIPWPSYNQDHRTVYEAALVALRPHDRNHFVPRVFAYEECHVAFWDWAQPGTTFQPTYFVPLDMERKLALYRLMASQVRGHRSQEHLRALATVRGGAAGVPAAEGFMVLRWVAGR